MSEIFINKTKALAVTGHRVLLANFSKRRLKNLLKKFIEKEFDTFLIGMALGFDTLCFQTLEQLKQTYPHIKIVSCIPCRSQAYKFNSEQKKEYDRMLSVADGKIILSEEYTPTCMQKRNKFMVDNASALLAYLTRDFGGTANTVKYAQKTGVPVVFI